MTKPTPPAQGEPLIPHLELGEMFIVKGQKYKITPSNQLNPRNHEPLVTIKVVG